MDINVGYHFKLHNNWLWFPERVCLQMWVSLIMSSLIYNSMLFLFLFLFYGVLQAKSVIVWDMQAHEYEEMHMFFNHYDITDSVTCLISRR